VNFPFSHFFFWIYIQLVEGSIVDGGVIDYEHLITYELKGDTNYVLGSELFEL
jgi:hypothetical protein